MAISPVITQVPGGTKVNDTFYADQGDADSAIPSVPAAQPAPVATNKIVVTAGPAQAKFNQNSSDLSTLLGTLNQTPLNQDTSVATVGNTNDSYTQLLDKMSANSDAATKALISSIQSQRASNGAKIENEAKNYESGLQLLGIQKNEAQSTPDLLQGQIKNQESVAEQKLRDLDVQTNKAIMDANTAKDNNDLKTLQQKMDYIKTLNTQKQDALKTIADKFTSSATIADNVVAGVYDQLQGLAPEDQQTYLHKAADTYGIPYGSFVQAVAKQKYNTENQALTLAEKRKTLAGGGAAEKLLTPSEAASYIKNNPLVDISAGDSVADANQAVSDANQFTKILDTDVNDPNAEANNIKGPQGYLTYDYGTKLLNAIPAGVNKAQFVIQNRDVFNKHLDQYGLTDTEIKKIKDAQ